MTRAPRRPGRTVAAATALAGVGLALTACSTPSASAPTVATTPSPSALPSTSSAAAGSASASGHRKSTSPAAASTTPAHTASTAVVQQSSCTSIGIRVIRGGAAQGNEFAALQFTNTGSQPCQLVGFPRAQLLRKGAQVGSPAKPKSSRSTVYSLAPKATAESKLLDFSDCQAPLADHVKVTAPGTQIHAVRPVVLRACSLTVGPLSAAS